jgi:hypothetical protein
MVGLEVFRSQTAEHVLEVYRRAVAEYGVPKESNRPVNPYWDGYGLAQKGRRLGLDSAVG